MLWITLVACSQAHLVISIFPEETACVFFSLFFCMPAGIWTELSWGFVEILGVLGCSWEPQPPPGRDWWSLPKRCGGGGATRGTVGKFPFQGKKTWSCYHVRPEEIKWLDVVPHETGTSAMSGAGPILMILWKAQFNLFWGYWDHGAGWSLHHDQLYEAKGIARKYGLWTKTSWCWLCGTTGK